jgi:hypothetical protein
MAMRFWCVILCLLITQSTCVAGTNDFWQVMMRACDSEGNYCQTNAEFGTKVVALDTADDFDYPTGSVNAHCAWVACYDLGATGYGNGYCKDYRKSISGTAKVWNLKLRVGPSWAASSVYLRLWNPTGPTDINGTVPISLRVANDPTGTYGSGQVLIPSWDPDANGSQVYPAYTVTFGNASALVGGAAIELQLIAGTASEIECSVGQAKQVYAGQPVLLRMVGVTSGDSDRAGAWIACDGLPGLRVGSVLGLGRGEVVDLAGVVAWTDGVPVLTNAQVRGRHGASAPEMFAFSGAALGNDRRETLNYRGVNCVGSLCVVCGEVTARDTGSGVFYLDDGSNLTDGLGSSNDPYRGLRIVCGTGMTLPGVGSHVRVAGIRSVEKHVLAQDAQVNGETRHSGDAIYVPVVMIRDPGDIQTIAP